MARVTLYIAMFLLLMNTTAMAIDSSGASEDWGLSEAEYDPTAGRPGAGAAIDAAESDSKDVTATGEGNAQTLFTLFISAVGSIDDILKLFVLGGPVMLYNLGFPDWLLTLIFAPAYVVVAADFVHLLTGRDTV